MPTKTKNEYQVTSEFLGYVSKKDITNLPEVSKDEHRVAYLVSPSQNVLSNDGERIGARPGFTLDGAASTDLYPIRSSYDWITHLGSERNLRLYNQTLQVRYGGVWYSLKTDFGASVVINFAEYWDTTESMDFLLMVDGTTNVYEWSGAITTFASATANTITKQGSGTWAASGFLTAGTREVIINGTTYAYTGGESTTTLTGVTPDPTSAGHAVASVVLQAIRTTANSAIGTLPDTFANDLIANLNNQIYYGSLTDRRVFVSDQNNYKDCGASSPRVPGEGATITLDQTPIGFVVQEDTMYASSYDFWYQVEFKLSADLTKEAFVIKRLKTAPGQGAKSQALIWKIKNEIVFVSNEPTLDTLGRIENIDTPQSVPLSDLIKTDFDSYTFTNGHGIYHKNNIYLALPSEGLVLIYNLARGFWEAPQVLPVRRFAIIGGSLYGHSSAVPETYKLFDTSVYSDNENPYHCIAAFSYQNFGTRTDKKNFTHVFSEGYISPNTTLDAGVKLDFGGYTSVLEYEIKGNDSAIIFQTEADGSLGKSPIGKNPIGSVTDSISNLPKFRVFHSGVKQDFYEVQMVYESNEVGMQWELLAFGQDATISGANNNDITK